MAPPATGQVLSLGQILLRHGVITEQELENAVSEQKRSHTRLGAVLLESGACTENDIAAALAGQLRLPVASIDPDQVAREVVEKLGEDWFREHLCLPLRSSGGNLRLAVADPFDVETSEAVQRCAGQALLMEVTTPETIQETLDSCYDQRGRIDALLSKAAEEALPRGRRRAVAEGLSAEELVRAFLAEGIRRGSADVHVEPEDDLLRVRYRIDGILQPGPMIPSEMTSSIIAKIKILAKLDISERRLPQDGRASLNIDGRTFDLRVSILPTVKGECVVIRVLDSSKALIPEEKMGLSRKVGGYLKKIICRPHGIFLVTGPTGSGKSTTLYWMLSRVNALERKVITVEDPVEYQLPLIRQVQVHPDIGLTFARGLRSILRQDPDVILLGEIRDRETAEIAIRAAMTGHMVLSTLHTNSAIGATARLVDIGIDPFLVTATLCGVLGQRLLRTLCPECSQPCELSPLELKSFSPSLSTSSASFRRAVGCAHCGGTGFKGRIAIYEALPMSNPLRRLVIQKATEEVLLNEAKQEDFEPLYLDAQHKVIQGLSTLEEVNRVVLGEG